MSLGNKTITATFYEDPIKSEEENDSDIDPDSDQDNSKLNDLLKEKFNRSKSFHDY